MHRLRHKFVAVALLLLLLFAYIMFKFLSSDLEAEELSKRRLFHEKLFCSVPVTFVIRDVEIFENDLKNTVSNIRQKYFKCDILILPDSLLYPPVDLNYDDIRILPLVYNLHRPQNALNVDTLIKTDYVFMIPDGIRLEPDSVEAILEEVKVRDVKIIALGVDERLGDCVQVNVDLKRWTLTFKHGEMDYECDAYSNDVALLVHKSVLGNLTDPFVRPLSAFFAQTKLRNYKISRFEDMTLPRPVKLYSGVRGRWKRSEAQKSRRKDFYLKSGIKKAEYASGEIEWYGCEKTSARCFPTVHEKMPDYLYKGRWTPPCCLKALRETARHVFQVLEEAGVRYWLEGGSLLGAARHKDIIPWDYDVDLGIYREDIVKCDLLKNCELQPIIDDQGFVWEKAREGDFYRVQYSDKNRLHVDIFPFYPKNGIMTKDTWFEDHRQDCEFPEQYLKPMSKIDFVGTKASAPNSVKEFLEFKFGVGVIDTPEYPNPAKKAFDSNENG